MDGPLPAARQPYSPRGSDPASGTGRGTQVAEPADWYSRRSHDWSDSRLKRGGIGFFSPHGEESRVRWVQVTHQYDMLGRLCAYLAPYNIATTNGSW